MSAQLLGNEKEDHGYSNYCIKEHFIKAIADCIKDNDGEAPRTIHVSLPTYRALFMYHMCDSSFSAKEGYKGKFFGTIINLAYFLDGRAFLIEK